MASLRKIKNSFFVRFRVAGQQFERDVGGDAAHAEAMLKHVEATVLDIKNGRIKLPDDADVAQFVLSDGEETAKPKLPDVLTLADLFQRYEAVLPEGAREPTTMTTYRIHRDHLLRIVKAKKAVQQIDRDELQAYVNQRSKEGVVRDTIEKELSTLGLVWNWTATKNPLIGKCPTKGLLYPKAKEKKPFLTWAEIEAAITHGGMTKEQTAELWDCLFLDTDQIAELLVHVKATARQPFVYPMFAFVALTGCRRSEMIRSQRQEVSVQNLKVTIREKKRDPTVAATFRYVTMHPFLAQVMREWFAVHPGGFYTFCQLPNVPLTVKEAWYHFKGALADSKWSVLRGFHVFRHSFASNLARAGKDQRVIDEFLGHQTDQMRQRYRHLFPDTKQDAIEAAFGSTAL